MEMPEKDAGIKVEKYKVGAFKSDVFLNKVKVAALKDSLMPRYAELIYYGFWFSPEREMLQALIDKSQEHVEGEVTLKLYKGNVIVIGRSSPKSLYSDKIVTFEDDAGAYDQKDAQGFIKLNALRLRLLGKRDKD